MAAAWRACKPVRPVSLRWFGWISLAGLISSGLNLACNSHFLLLFSTVPVVCFISVIQQERTCNCNCNCSTGEMEQLGSQAWIPVDVWYGSTWLLEGASTVHNSWILIPPWQWSIMMWRAKVMQMQHVRLMNPKEAIGVYIGRSSTQTLQPICTCQIEHGTV